MKVHLVDGTYELFRAYFGAPPRFAPDGRPVGAVVGLIRTLLSLLRQDDVTHVGIAFDHVIESFRNQIFDGYKTGDGLPEDLLSQFNLAERAAKALGLVVWPMTEFEADDVIATAAARWRDCPDIEQIVICSPDKDFAQLVSGSHVVTLDRRKEVLLDEAGVVEKFGVVPGSIPDYLALVGDSSDGIPGIPRWGVKSTAMVLTQYHHIECIPADPSTWETMPRGAAAMSKMLNEKRELAYLYKRLATLKHDVPLTEDLVELEWIGASEENYGELCAELGVARLRALPHIWIGAGV